MGYCEDEGMVIASIHSQEEYQAVWDMIECHVYIGAESYGTGEWSWYDGSEWDYVSPNNDGITGVGEHHIAMLTDGVWHDWGTGSSTHGVLCRGTSDSIEPACRPEDLNQNGQVDFYDLVICLAEWDQSGLTSDLDGDGFTSFQDLLLILSAWGDC